MPETPDNITPSATPPKKKYVRAVGPRLRILLLFIFGLVAVLAANSVYLSAITFLEWLKANPNQTYQNWFYMVMFGAHLALGLLLVLPLVIFGAVHIRNAHDRPNRRAVKVGYVLFTTSLVVLVTGLLLAAIPGATAQSQSPEITLDPTSGLPQARPGRSPFSFASPGAGHVRR